MWRSSLPAVLLALLQLPVPAALVARYKLDAASGNQTDSSGDPVIADAIPQGSGQLYNQEAVPGGQYGAITLAAGAVTASAGFASGTSTSSTDAWAATTTAGAGTVTAPAKLNNLVNNFTVAAWIKPSSATRTSRVFSTATGAVTNHVWGFGFSSAGRIRLTDFGQYDIDAATATITANTWQHIAATKSSTGGIRLYHNGNLVHTDASRTASVTAVPTSTTAWRLLHGPLGEIFIGLAADVRVYNTALTQPEILAAAGHQAGPTGVLATDFRAPEVPGNPYLNFAHGVKTATTAADLSLFGTATAASANKPAGRLGDAADNLWTGKAPADAPGVAFPSAGGPATDWLSGKVYHAWSGGRTDILATRYTVPSTGYYDLAASWQSHTRTGAMAQVHVVHNGATLFNAAIDGYSGVPASPVLPSGPARTAAYSLPGYSFSSGDTVDVITVPDAATPAGNLALDFTMLPVAGPPVATATVVISEFLASNTKTHADEDGQFGDWIELYNGTGAPVDLTGWSLTDNAAQPKKWVFPARTLAHGQFLVVFADSRDSEKRPFYTPLSQLHTSFSLSAGGEYLGLVNAAGTVVDSYAPAYPAQVADIAYGRAGSAGPGFGYLTATPGRINGAAASAPPAVVTFSVPSGVFVSGNPQSVALIAPPTHTIRYTLNNTEPTIALGTSYTGTPLTVSGSTIIRARAFIDGTGGPLSEAQYLCVASSVQPNPADSYTLPVLVIDTLGGGTLGGFGGESPQKAALLTFYEPDQTGKTSMTAPPKLISRGGSHVRGQSSATYKKQGLDLEFWDETGGDRQVSLLGMPSNGDWALYAPYEFDRTYMNNRLAYELASRMGRYASRTKYVELYVNTDGGVLSAADYYGVYVLVETVERNKDRVDVESLTPEQNNAPDVTGGYIVSINKSDETETVLAASLPFMRNMRQNKSTITLTGGMTTFLDYPEVSAVTSPQKTYIDNYLKLTEEAIYGTNFTHPVSTLHYTSYIGRDTFIDYHIAQTIPQNIDALRLSTFYYKQRNGKLKAGPVWDYDRAFNSRDSRNATPGVWDTQGSTDKTEYFHYGWWHRLFQDADFMQLWIDRYWQLRQPGGALDRTGVIVPLIDAYAAELIPPGTTVNAASRDYVRWAAGAGGGGTGLSGARQPLATEVAAMKTWLNTRFNFMDGQMLRIPSASARDAGTGAVTFTLTGGTASAGIYVTTDGSDPRLPGGNLNPAAVLVPNGGTITVNTSGLVRYRHRDLSAAAFNSDLTTTKMSRWSGLGETYYIAGALPAAAGNLTVSALHYHPSAPTAEEVVAGFIDADDFEYVELMNISASRVNLNGCRMSEGFDFTFTPSALVELAPGERVVLAKKAAAFALRYGTAAAARVIGEFGGNDNLINSGEPLTLLAGDGVTPVFSFSYDDAAPWPAEADGAGPGLVLIAPLTNPALGNGLNWRPSSTPGGKPGASDSQTYAAWKTANSIADDTADTDGDGLPPVLEYALGTSPAVPSQSALPVITFLPDRSVSITFSKALNADDVIWEVQTTADTAAPWTTASPVLQSRTFAPAPAAAETLTLSLPAAAGPVRFVRMKFALR